ncbi:11247_t:CDS:2, partial [Gigaspora rosea]
GEVVSEASLHRMDDSGEVRIGCKTDFRVKYPLVIDGIELCLIEVSRVLPTDRKIPDERDAHVRLMGNLTRGGVGKVKDLEEDLNRIPVFGIQVA